MKNWIESDNKNFNMILSSRIRLARNLKNLKFPNKLNDEESKKVILLIENSIYSSPYFKNSFKTIYLKDNTFEQNKELLEKRLISTKLLNNYKNSACIVNEDETISIMINEEDHIRVQCITSDLNLNNAYEEANKIDDLLEEKLNYAFDEKLGYLTACPTNIGTGLRASVMIHLPILSMNREMSGVLKALTQVGMTIRGIYGEGSEAVGSIYQISNQITLGISEEETLNNLTAIINEIINEEQISREKILKTHRYEIEDKIFRSLGILKNNILLGPKECLTLISNVRMGVEMGIIDNISIKTLNFLMIKSQTIGIDKKMNERDRSYERAKLLRKNLN